MVYKMDGLQLQSPDWGMLGEHRRSVVLWCLIAAGCVTPIGATRAGLKLLLEQYYGKLPYWWSLIYIPRGSLYCSVRVQ